MLGAEPIEDPVITIFLGHLKAKASSCTRLDCTVALHSQHEIAGDAMKPRPSTFTLVTKAAGREPRRRKRLGQYLLRANLIL
jgi:hypothetical protein